MIRKKFLINGLVQGVGFRPFVYRLANKNSLVGFIKNDVNGVEIELEGDEKNINLFETQLHSQLPPLARIDKLISKNTELCHEKSFEILQSSQNPKKSKTALISPDISTCQECLSDIKKDGKYHNYFATNCTNCGPRYSITKTVPYDRVNTSMNEFEMCKSCQEEYRNPRSRRYHAQPISCKNCGPTLSLWHVENKKEIQTKNIFLKVYEFIKDGNILAIKGIGGFHIICDATNDEAVLRLREYKNRPSKPLAIMCKNIKQIKSLADINEKEEELLSSKEAPIVVLKKNPHANISRLVAPKIDRVGCMLAYTPLHHLLFEYLDSPIVATSANLANEPIIVKAEEIFEKLSFIDYVLDFNREIINGVDDSLLQVVNSRVQMLRLARGYTPKVIKLASKRKKNILAVGANAKNSIVLVMEDKIILSPHIGYLDSIEAFSYFERTIETFKKFYDFKPEVILHDKHPNYETTKYSKKQNIKRMEIGHHLAHIYACKAEFGLSGDYLGFSFDGTGYGENSELWGGEVFVGDRRKYSFKPIKLLGAEKAIKEPRRVALSMLFDKLSLEEVLKLDLACVNEFPHANIKMLYQSYIKNLNAPRSSSVGRLFDAIASFSELTQIISYEGESGLLCESYYDKDIEMSFEYTIKEGVIDIQIVEAVLKSNLVKKELNSMFINTLVKIIVEITKRENMEVILSGGVFQNKTLLELVIYELKKTDIICFYQQETSINDGGIALGQAYYFLQRG